MPPRRRSGSTGRSPSGWRPGATSSSRSSYRGTFASAGPDGPRTEASFDTWGQRDVTAAARALRHLAPGLPLAYLGHSLGRPAVPRVRGPGPVRVRRYVAVASGNGYWRRLKTRRARLGLFLATQVWAPALLPALGYFPGRRLRKVGDLPRGVMAQWHRWCAAPAYLAVDAEQRARFAAVATPFTSLHASDDESCSPTSAWRCSPGSWGAPKNGRCGSAPSTLSTRTAPAGRSRRTV